MKPASCSSFAPDWASAPGETIAAAVQARGVGRQKVALALGRSVEWFEALLAGEVPLTTDVAAKLEHEFGVAASFWMSREAAYRENLSRLQQQWIAHLPVRDMIDFGWIPPSQSEGDQLSNCLSFFGVATLEGWWARYRQLLDGTRFRTSSTFRSKETALAAWLRRAEIEATSIECKAWDAGRLRDSLGELRELTRKHNPSRFIPELQRICAEAGVLVVVVPAPSGCVASGVTRFLTAQKAMIALSLRYLSDDHFWFTLFHEFGHLLLHSQQRTFLEVEGAVSEAEEQAETEANEFAAAALIPRERQHVLRHLPAQARPVVRFARQIGISPGIVVGQMQHLGLIRYNQLNGLKRRFEWE